MTSKTNKKATSVQKLRIMHAYDVVDGQLVIGKGHRLRETRSGKPIKTPQVKLDGVTYEAKRLAYFILKGRWTRGNIYLIDKSAGFTKDNMYAKSDAQYQDDRSHERWLKTKRKTVRVKAPKRASKGRSDRFHGISLGEGSRRVTALPTLDEQESVAAFDEHSDVAVDDYINAPTQSEAFPTAERELELKRLGDAAKAKVYKTESVEEFLARGGKITVG